MIYRIHNVLVFIHNGRFAGVGIDSKAERPSYELCDWFVEEMSNRRATKRTRSTER